MTQLRPDFCEFYLIFWTFENVLSTVDFFFRICNFNLIITFAFEEVETGLGQLNRFDKTKITLKKTLFNKNSDSLIILIIYLNYFHKLYLKYSTS